MDTDNTETDEASTELGCMVLAAAGQDGIDGNVTAHEKFYDSKWNFKLLLI